MAIKGWNTITTATTSADSSSSSYDNSNSSGLHGGAIAGIVIGIVAAAAIIGAGIVFFLRRRRRQGRDVGETAETETKTSELDSKQYVNVPQDPGHPIAWTSCRRQAIRLNCTRITVHVVHGGMMRRYTNYNNYCHLKTCNIIVHFIYHVIFLISSVSWDR